MFHPFLHVRKPACPPRHQFLIELEINHVRHQDHVEPPTRTWTRPNSSRCLRLSWICRRQAESWPVYLHGRNIPVVVDDLGRGAVSREAARQLFD